MAKPLKEKMIDVAQPTVECPHCHKEFANTQALSSHLAFKHGTTLKAERVKLKSDGNVKKALAATQENVGRMAESLAKLDIQTREYIKRTSQLALASWYASQAAQYYGWAMAAKLAGNYKQAAEYSAQWEANNLRSMVEFHKYEALIN